MLGEGAADVGDRECECCAGMFECLSFKSRSPPSFIQYVTWWWRQHNVTTTLIYMNKRMIIPDFLIGVSCAFSKSISEYVCRAIWKRTTRWTDRATESVCIHRSECWIITLCFQPFSMLDVCVCVFFSSLALVLFLLGEPSSKPKMKMNPEFVKLKSYHIS